MTAAGVAERVIRTARAWGISPWRCARRCRRRWSRRIMKWQMNWWQNSVRQTSASPRMTRSVTFPLTQHACVRSFLTCLFSVASVRSEEHQATGLRRSERSDGHEHHLQRQERDQMDRVPHQLGAGMSGSGGQLTLDLFSRVVYSSFINVNLS